MCDVGHVKFFTFIHVDFYFVEMDNYLLHNCYSYVLIIYIGYYPASGHVIRSFNLSDTVWENF